MPGPVSRSIPILTVAENLRFFASVFGTTIERERAQIRADLQPGSTPFATRRASALSGGMKQKLALCLCPGAPAPRFLFSRRADDRRGRRLAPRALDLLGQLKASGITIVVSTPYMG